MPTYTYSYIKSRLHGKIKGKSGIIVSVRDTINEAVRQVITDVDLQSTIRKTPLTPNLFRNIFEYASPSDLKASSIITIEPQTDRARRAYTLTTPEEFNRRKDANTIAIDDYDFIKKVLVNTDQSSDKGFMIESFDTATGWSAVGSAENIEADSDNYVRENASLKFDIGAAAVTTAGVQNTTLDVVDISEYLGGNGAIFVWAYINSATNLTNFILRIGSSNGNYYQKTITAASDGTAFRAGWNLLRFDLTNLSETGSPDATACDYVALYMTKTTGKVSETGYRFDSLMVKKGEINNIKYYSKYPWQNISGTYLENSTADSDYVNADSDEINLILKKVNEMAADEVDEEAISKKMASEYKKDLALYKLAHSSQALLMVTTYADFIKT